MGDWRTRPLGEVFDVQLGKMLGAGSKHGDQFQYLANRNVQWGRIVIDELGTMNFSSTERKRYRLRSGDLLVCEGGEVGRAALWSDELPECYFQNALHRLRATSDANPRFMRHYFEFAAMAGSFRALTGQTSIGHLPRANLVRWPVPVPPLEEQRRIAEILDAIDETIQATERVIAKLWTIREGILRDRLLDLLNYPMASIEDLGADVTVGIVVRPTQYYVTDGIPVLRSANIREGRLDMTNLVYMSPGTHSLMAKTAVTPGDLLTVRTGYPGTTAVVPSTVPAANCVDVVITRPLSEIDPEFLALWINSEFGKGHVLARQGGLAQQHFNVSEMKALPVPVVDMETQRKLVESDRLLRLRLHSDQMEMDKLQATRAGLASDLLSGRVRTVAP